MASPLPRRRVPLHLIIPLTIAGVASLASACSGSDETTQPAVTTRPAASSVATTGVATSQAITTTTLGNDGAQIFAKRCASCHGSDGTGNVGPPVVGIADRMSEQAQVELVTAGRGTMPAFSPGLTDEQIRAVVTYTRTQLR